MGKSLLLILAAVLMGVSGQLCLKSGMAQIGTVEATRVGDAIRLALRVFSTPLILAGLAFYGLGTIFWLLVLSRLDLSLAYPMLALTYVLIPLSARLILGEQVPGLRWVGVGIIMVGVMIVART